VTTATRASALLAVLALALAACRAAPADHPAAPADQPSATSPPALRPPPPSPGRTGGYSKVMIIAEENHAYDQIIGSPDAPYLNTLAAMYGVATHLDAGYPTRCPSLAAYILLTSGSTAGICDDRAPKGHLLTGDSLFQQVDASGRQWRNYAESAQRTCELANGADGRYLVRHVPATYYVNQRARCESWAVPMGHPAAGALHDDLARGLPAFSFLSPDACNDMHGAASCPTDRIGSGDRWLHGWLPTILQGADYRAGRLALIITWDEGTRADNHIPTLVISPTTSGITADTPLTHCSTLRTIEELLRLPLLGCAADAATMTTTFRL
jgi:hypothetical protein